MDISSRISEIFGNRTIAEVRREGSVIKVIEKGRPPNQTRMLMYNGTTFSTIKKWLEQGEKKIVLKTESEDSLVKLYNAFKYKKVPCALVADAGLTELPPGTRTALGVGPWMSEELDDITGRLKLF